VNTPTIKTLAPYTTFENITFQQNSSQLLGSINAIAGTPGTNDGFGCTINNCSFHVHLSTGYGAILFDSGRYNTVMNSQFWHCVVGVNLGASAMTIQGARVLNNDFHGLDTDVDTDIQVASGGHILIDGNRFNHAQPNYTTGAYKKYLEVVTAGTGILSNNYFGTTATNMQTACTLQSVVDVANKCGADTVWMKASS
jgi:hypothetical protein